MPINDSDYKQIFTQLIKKQMLILGPDITLAKVKNVPGLTVEATGEVINIQGDPQVLLQNLINQFVELSGMIVKKTMESILTSYPNLAGLPSFAPPSQNATEGQSKATEGQESAVQAQPVATPPVQPPVQPHVEAAQPAASPITMPSIEEISSSAPPSQNATEGQSKAMEGQATPTSTPPPVQVQRPPEPTQTVASQNPAALDDLSPEEVEKLNKMIQEMNQMPEEDKKPT